MSTPDLPDHSHSPNRTDLKKAFKKRMLKRVLLMVLLAIVGLVVLSFIVMHLWNFVIPAVFTGVSSITFMQAAAILVLAKILFGSFGPKGRRGGCGHKRRQCGGHGKCGGGQRGLGHGHRGHGGHGSHSHLSEEERQALKARFAEKVGHHHPE